MIKELQPCGTPAAFLRHRRKGERPCDACRDANREYMRNLEKRLRSENPQPFRDKVKRHREKDIEKYRARDRAQWHKLTPQEKYERRRIRSLKRYGLTPESFDALLAIQNDRCAACGAVDPGRKGWCIDHDHTAGLDAVRGLLCLICNVVLGMMGDDLEGAKRYGWTLGIEYLERTSPMIQERLMAFKNNPAPIDGAGYGQA